MQFELKQDHPEYGSKGRIIEHYEYFDIPAKDKHLFKQVKEKSSHEKNNTPPNYTNRCNFMPDQL